MRPKREIDLEARRLIGRVCDLERQGWPEARDAYAEALLALAIRCEAKPGKAEILRWLLRVSGGLFNIRDARWRECAQDALHEVVALSAGQLLRCRSGLEAAPAPNLRSMFGAIIWWRAKGFFESRYRRHVRHLAPWAMHAGRVAHTAGPSRPVEEAIGREVWALLDPGSPGDAALMLVGVGFSIAEAARRTGLSRQVIYRCRADFAKRCGHARPGGR